MTHIDLPKLPGPVLKALIEYAASNGKKIVAELHQDRTFYRLLPIGSAK